MKRGMKKYAVGLLAGALTAANCMTAFAGSWKQDSKGWWYQKDDGSYYNSGWQWIDGNNDGVSECYYFSGDGYALINTTTPDGYTVNGDGAWTVNGVLQTQGSTQAVQNGVMLQAGGFILEYDLEFADFSRLLQLREEKRYYTLDEFRIRDSSGHNYLSCNISDVTGLSLEQLKKNSIKVDEMYSKWQGKHDIKDYIINGRYWYGYEDDERHRINVETVYENRKYDFTYDYPELLAHKLSAEELMKKIKFTNDFSTIFVNADGEITTSTDTYYKYYFFQLKK